MHRKKKYRVYGVSKKMVRMANPDSVRTYQKAQISYIANNENSMIVLFVSNHSVSENLI